jgi:xanthine dehydrogenase YagS FAD-binding subunit
MINNFAYVKAGSISEAVKALSTESSKLHAGGTDLLGCLRDGIIQVEKVVSISNLKSLKKISTGSGGGLEIGALTPLADIALNGTVTEKYPVLAQAAEAVGSPQIRQQGTLGGNLCQRPRCWYFRNDLHCRKKGGDTCYAMGGENQYHAIFGGGPCFFVHPSDTAVALTALGAELTITGSSGSKSVKIEDFFVGPKQSVEKENILLSNEIITAIQLPPLSTGVRSSYRKIRARAAWDFALVSVAAVLQFEGNMVRAARIALGGVAAYPWRIEKAEKMVEGKKLDAAVAAEAAGAAVDGALPLRDNGYKLEMVKGTVEESLLDLSSKF